jgi:hypothetical protein
MAPLDRITHRCDVLETDRRDQSAHSGIYCREQPTMHIHRKSLPHRLLASNFEPES